jgi:hypothetical protein
MGNSNSIATKKELHNSAFTQQLLSNFIEEFVAEYCDVGSNDQYTSIHDFVSAFASYLNINIKTYKPTMSDFDMICKMVCQKFKPNLSRGVQTKCASSGNIISDTRLIIGIRLKKIPIPQNTTHPPTPIQ